MTRSRKLALTAAVASLALAALSVSDAHGLRRYLRLTEDIASYQERIRALSTENASLRREIGALSGDLRALERAAREDLGLVRSSEVVFTFEK
jgi:cell division protein FtsB